MDFLFNILQVSTWAEVPLVLLDVAIVYYIIYRILLLIKGTRAAQMLLGLLLVLVFFFMSGKNLLDLRITNWFLDKVIANFIIIVVIIFQGDIRRALAQAGGRTSIFRQQSALQESYILEEIIKASSMLATRQIGALIVLEREASLREFVERGIELDASVTKDLLFSLFLPEHQNPLHDGAAVIQKDRVAAAGCVLPLTNNPRVDKSFGTRHRAGIGLSEDYDSAVVIVSEETGMISVAFAGELYRNLETAELRELLQKIFRTTSGDTEQVSLHTTIDKLRVQGKATNVSQDSDPEEATE